VSGPEPALCQKRLQSFFDEFEPFLGVPAGVHLAHRDDDVRHTEGPRQADVLAGLAYAHGPADSSLFAARAVTRNARRVPKAGFESAGSL